MIISRDEEGWGGAGDQGEGHSTWRLGNGGRDPRGLRGWPLFEILYHLLHALLFQGKEGMGLVTWQVQVCMSEQGVSPVALSWGTLMRAVPSKLLNN